MQHRAKAANSSHHSADRAARGAPHLLAPPEGGIAVVAGASELGGVEVVQRVIYDFLAQAFPNHV